MRKLLLLILASAICCVSAYSEAIIKWQITDYDFGAFHESAGPATAVFIFYNTGDEPLVVSGARANCGCTKPRYSADVVQPGDSATLTVTYDPGGRPGRFEKNVYVDTNTADKRSTLTIKGVVVGSPETLQGRYPVEVGELRLAHPAALLGALDKGQVKAMFESYYNASTDTLEPVITDAPKWLVVKAVPARIPPGEQGSFSLMINSADIPDWDMVTDSVTIKPSADSNVSYRMPVVVTVSENFRRLSDDELAKAPVATVDKERLDPVSMTPDGVVTSFSITNTGKSPLKIRRLYTRTLGVVTDIKKGETIKPGKSRTVKVTIPPSVLDDTDATSIMLTLVSNTPGKPKTTVTIPVTK